MKGVIYNQEKPYSGLENGRRYWGGGEAVNGGALLGGGGTTVYIMHYIGL